MRIVSALACACLAALATGPAAAQSVADFYKGLQVNLLIVGAAGGGYDIDGRLVSRHIGKRIPGQPRVVAQNLPGAGGIRLANTLYNTSPQDGSHIGLLMNTAAMLQAIGAQGIQYDAAKFGWLGSLSPAVDTMAVWHTEGIASVEDATKKPSIAAATGKGANSTFIPAAMNELLGTKFKIVMGYLGGAEMNLALERGEAGARGTSWSSWTTTAPDWIRDRKIVLLGYAGPKPKDMPDGVPSLIDLAKSEDDKSIMRIVFSGAEFGRPFAVGPGVPPARAQALRAAFVAMMKDAEFLAEAAQLKVEVDPVSGDHLQDVAVKLVATPPHLAARAKALVE